MKRLLLLAAMAALALGASADGYKLEKVWTLNALDYFSVTNDVRQGFGMDGKFYIHNKVDQAIYIIDENGLTNQSFPGGLNCGISRDEAGNILVSNATFPGSWIEATLKVINPNTGDVVEYTIPEETGLIGRCDFIGYGKGNFFEDGVLYLTGGNTNNDGTPYTDGIAIFSVAGGEVDFDNCYLATCNGLATNTSTVINYYNDLNGDPALLFAYRSGAPGKLVPDGDNFTRTGLVLPNKGACNGVFPIIWDGKELFIYPTLPNYQDGWAIAEAGAETPLAEVPSSASGNPNGIQCNWLNAEVDENGVTIYQYVPGGQISVYRLTKEVEVPNVYILGEVNEQGWAANAGTPMEYDAENKVYTATVVLDGRGESGENYFSFTTELANDNDDGGWAYIAPFRFGAVSEGDFWFDDMYLGQELDLTYENGQAYRVMAGEYELTLSLENMKLIINKAYIRGDVDEDKQVGISDVTTLIDILLTGASAPAGADCDLDNEIGISDVTTLIDFLLTGVWPE